MKLVVASVLCALWTAVAAAQTGDRPRARDERLVVELFAEQPDIVTPTGLAVADDGRVFVAESHTHFRPDDYDGPQADRILAFRDTDGDGKADQRTVFHEGFVHVMDIEFYHRADYGQPLPKGRVLKRTGPKELANALYVATRRDIHRLRDTDGDGTADEITLIVKLETEGNYPHNGLSGIAFEFDGSFHFGLGENLGAPYTLVGSDGTKLSGGGEGGGTYHVRADGTALRRVTTGWWNPYGMCVDAYGRVFGTDNDPDASPPCRLIQVVEGGDYGYEFRYGRSGRHPLICWNGEIPGTLPMISGTGEAPCAIVAYEASALPPEYLGNLFVPCWADHRVERYEIVPRVGKGLVDVRRDTLIEGSDDFRPVGIDVAPDGTIYVSDWVSSSYTLHKLGRIWRIRPQELAPVEAVAKVQKSRFLPKPMLPAEQGLSESVRASLRSHDPLVFHYGVEFLSHQYSKHYVGLADEDLGLGVLLAAKRSETLRSYVANEALDLFLQAHDPRTRFAAVKWIADDKLVDYRPDLEELLAATDLDYRLFLATVAALERLDGKPPTDRPPPELLLAKITADDAPLAIRRLCLRLIDPQFQGLELNHLTHLLQHADVSLRVEAVRTSAAHPDPQRRSVLVGLAEDRTQPESVQAEAVLGLAREAAEHLPLLMRLAHAAPTAVQLEALRALVGTKLTSEQQAQLQGLGEQQPDLSAAVRRVLTGSVGERPAKEETRTWLQSLGQSGDPQAGERIFFGTQVGTCSKCHAVDGRGNDVGPDLSIIGRRIALEGEQGPAWLMETILQPSKNMAPHFTPWQIVTKDGKTWLGLPRRKGGSREAYLGIDGREFILNKDDIEHHQETTTSIMPEGLLQNLTAQELSDLFAFIALER